MADQKMTKEKGAAAAKTTKNTGGTRAKSRSAQTGGTSVRQKNTQSKKSSQTQNMTKRKTKGREDNFSEEPLSASMKEEIALAVTLLVSMLFFLSYINLCGAVGKWLNTFVFGMFGIFGYLFPFLLFFGVAFFISNRKNRIVKRKLLCSAAFFLCLTALIELLSSYDPERTWAQYFTMSAEGKNGGGIVGGTLVFLLCPLFDTVATTIIFIILMIICLMIVTGKEIFAYIRSITGESVQEYRIAVMERRQKEREEEEFADEFSPGRDLPEESLRDRRMVVFQKPGGTSGAPLKKKDPVRFVDALKERGKKGFRATPSAEESAANWKEPSPMRQEPEIPASQAQVPQEQFSQADAPMQSPVMEEKAPVQEESQEVAGITISGDYQPENISFYEEELKRKFGGEKNDMSKADRTFYGVSVSDHGASVKESEVTLIRKDWYDDDEPLIPQRINNKEQAEETQKAPEDSLKKEVDEKIQPVTEFISADMIFANAGIDPAIHTSAPVLEKKDNFWPDMSVQEQKDSNPKGIQIFSVSSVPSLNVQEQREVLSSATKKTTLPESVLEGTADAFTSLDSASEETIGTFTLSDNIIERTTSTFTSLDSAPERTAGEIFPPDNASEEISDTFTLSEDVLTDTTSALVSQNQDMSVGAIGSSMQNKVPARPQNTSPVSTVDASIKPLTFLPPVSEKKYEFPPIDLLAEPVQGKGANERELKETAAKLQSTLQSFGVRVTVTNISCGPTVTQYELQPEQGVKVNQITKLSDDIKLNLAATDIRIEAPIPGKAAVGIEVPNKENSPVILRELLESAEFKKHKSELAFAVGKNISGQIVVSDIAKMPHMLIAGATGSGKSVCINTIIMSILYKANPKDVKLIMVDPKVVELSVYNGIPHLLIPVVTDPKKASAALQWAVSEMTDRYQKFAALSVRDLAGYNAKVDGFDEPNPSFPRLPKIVIIVDELADLMMVAAANEVEEAICRLAQMARAAGLYLIIATQRPSVNVITGVIKANVPSRVAFAVTSAVDSRTILDGVGAERLLGKGDMLFFPSGYPKPVRIQGAFVSDSEVSAVVDFLKEQAQDMEGYNEEVNQKIMNTGSEGGGISGADGNDDYFVEAGRFIIEKQKASIGMLQRVYKIGFNRAARIMDQLTAAGVVGPEEGTKPRKILMTQTEFDEYLGGNS